MLEKDRLLDNAYQYAEQCFAHLKALPISVFTYSDSGDYLYSPPVQDVTYKEVWKTLSAICYMTKVQAYIVVSGCNMLTGNTRVEKEKAVEMIKEKGLDSGRWEGTEEGMVISFYTANYKTQRVFRVRRDDSGRIRTLIHLDDMPSHQVMVMRGLEGLIHEKEVSLDDFYQKYKYTWDDAVDMTHKMMKRLGTPIERDQNWKEWFRKIMGGR